MCGSTRSNYFPEEMSCFIIRSSVDTALGGELVGGHVGNVNASLDNSQGLLSSVLVQGEWCEKQLYHNIITQNFFLLFFLSSFLRGSCQGELVGRALFSQ